MEKGAELCFPHLFNNSCIKPTLHWSKAVLLNIVLSCISLITAGLNLLVIISVSHFRQLHTPSNILLLSLAVSDFLVGLLLIPAEIFRITVCWVFAFYSTLCTKNILIEPGRYNSCYGECVFITSDIAGIIDLVLSFIVPVSIIIVLYMRVFVVAVSQARAMHSHVTATLQQDKVSDSSASIVVIVYYFNSCLNPLIYALFYPWFRNAVKVIITFQIFKHDSSEVNVI
uniref:trace amine-associated receptor 6-like n=1 Tax=Maylandia zebra TaxID=106582 RepID=UPI000D2FAFD6|nr:trace amine-associated receptor 6-like [Maylandia zebra]